MDNTTVKNVLFFSCSQKGDLQNMAEIEKESVGFPVIWQLVAGEFTCARNTLFFFQFIYIVHQCKEDCTNM